MTALPDSIKYVEHKQKICGDLKMMVILLGMQLGYTIYCCFLCYVRQQGQEFRLNSSRVACNTSEKNVVAKPLVDLKDALAQAFKYLRGKFPRLSAAKIKESIFVGLQIRQLMKDPTFDLVLEERERKGSLRCSQRSFSWVFRE